MVTPLCELAWIGVSKVGGAAASPRRPAAGVTGLRTTPGQQNDPDRRRPASGLRSCGHATPGFLRPASACAHQGTDAHLRTGRHHAGRRVVGLEHCRVAPRSDSVSFRLTGLQGRAELGREADRSRTIDPAQCPAVHPPLGPDDSDLRRGCDHLRHGCVAAERPVLQTSKRTLGQVDEDDGRSGAAPPLLAREVRAPERMAAGQRTGEHELNAMPAKPGCPSQLYLECQASGST